METTVDIKKGKGIEGLLRGFAAGKPEEVKLIEVATNTDIETLLGRYKAFLGVGDIIHNIGDEEVNKIINVDGINETVLYMATVGWPV